MLKGFCQKHLQFRSREQILVEEETASSADSLLLVVIDQVQHMMGKIYAPAPPSSGKLNLSDTTFLLDSEGGGGLCFQALHEESTKQ